MESNWRFNVWDLGFTGSQYRLIARLDTPVFGYEYLLNSFEGQTVAVVGTPFEFEPSQQWAMQFTILGDTGLHFPYGFEVEPDRA